MQAQHLTEVLISSCAPVMRSPNTKGMQATKICTVGPTFDDLWFLVFRSTAAHRNLKWAFPFITNVRLEARGNCVTEFHNLFYQKKDM
jgi:hypothetical protein